MSSAPASPLGSRPPSFRVRVSRAGVGMGAGWMVRRQQAQTRSPARLVVGVVSVGVGVALVLTSGLGANSWDVLGVALAALTGLPLTLVFLAVGVVNLSGAMLLGRHPGPATLVPTLIYGPVIEVSLRLLPEPGGPVAAAAMFGAGFAVIALGAGAHLSSGHRPGPVDLLFRGLADHGWRPWQARLCIEGTALVVGTVLGGPAGIGTVILTVGLAFAIPAATDGLPAVRVRTPAATADAVAAG